MLRTKNVSYQYPKGELLEFPDISCGSGESALLLGNSGQGKTTLLQLLAGLRTPTYGEVIINDQLINNLSRGALDRFRGQNIGIVFQTAHFVNSISVVENLLLAQKLAGERVDRTRAQLLLDQLGIGNKAQKYPKSLSVGQQQRVAIARAIINRPAVILADEPTSALDDHNTRQVTDLLLSRAGELQAALLIVTHDNRLTSLIDKHFQL